MRRARRGRKASKHISISATDAQWETVRRNADRRGLSIARYLVGLVERDGREEDAGPALALAAEEQRELLEAVREVRALMLEGEEAVPLVRDMQERIAVRFAAWASAMAGSGRSEELRTALASVLGEERARIAAALVVPSAPKSVSLEALVMGVNGGAKMPHARRPGGPVAAAQKCATYGPLSVLARGGGCTAWSSMRRFGWRLSMRG